MQKKRILLADADSQAREEFQVALGDGWDIVAVANGPAALMEMEKEPCDVIVADLDLAEINGTELLNRIQSSYPKAIRFVMALEADRERVVKQVLGTHQFLGKPLESVSLKNSIEGAVALESWIPKASIRELVGRIRTLPTIPSLYLEVQAVLRSPDATTDQVGALIAKDMAMTTKLLQVLNSACFGLSRKITNPKEAVGILGFETVSSMVMTIKLLSQYDKVKPVYFSIDRLWRHSTEVARTAKQIALWQTEDAVIAEAAFTAGLMHDIGKVVLAANFDEQYRGAQSLARKQSLQLWEVEKEIFGASHGEIGAYMLGLWGMPVDLLEVAALHHHPQRSTRKNFSALTAVHIANALERELTPPQDGVPASKLDEVYLANTGVLEQIPAWRAAVAKRDFTKTAPRIKPVSAPAPATPRKTNAPVARPQASRPATFSFKNEWVYGIAAAAVVLLVMSWLTLQLLVTRTPVMARTEEPSVPKKVLPAPVPVVTPAKPAEPKPRPVVVASAAPVAPPVHAIESPVPKALPSLKVAAKETGLADLKLQGIFFSTSHPSAIINGQRVEPHDRVGDILIVDITSSTVTVEYQKKRKTLVLE